QKMPHQCVHCGEMYPAGSREILEGCSKCGGHFFFYIRDEQLKKIRENPIELPQQEKEKIEKDIREMANMEDEMIPVILDIESIRVISPGKYEIDVVNLFNKDRPVIFKISEGKYIIDLTMLRTDKSGIRKED
ncbi:MAG: Zn-ribbon containing protein, partial [Nanoarchaeota archaeon]